MSCAAFLVINGSKSPPLSCYVTKGTLVSSHMEVDQSFQVHPCLISDRLYRPMLPGVAKGKVYSLQQHLSEVVSLRAV